MDIFQSISEFIPFSVTIIIVVLVTSIIITCIFKIEYFNRFIIAIGILCAPGVVLHELGHLFFAVLSGCPIDEIKLLKMNRNYFGNIVQIEGYVKGEFPDSFLANFLISIGPVIINGIAVSLVVYFLPYLHEGLAYYLIFAFTLGAQPSIADMKNIFLPFKENPSKAWFEIFSTFVSLVPAWFVGTWNVNSVHEINWFFFVITYFLTLSILVICYKISSE